MPAAPHIIASLRGGLNEHPPALIADDQCTIAENIEWHNTPVGERRLGAVPINLTGSSLATTSWVIWLHRHMPTSDLADAQLWAFGITYNTGGPGVHSYVLSFKYYTPPGPGGVPPGVSAWLDVTLPDPPNLTDGRIYQMQARSLHGKMFLAYPSYNADAPSEDLDRLHVWDGSVFRRTGLAAATWTITAEGIDVIDATHQRGGGIQKQRWYRVRLLQVIGAVRKLQSEPTDAITVLPQAESDEGAGDGGWDKITITAPAGLTPQELETHWMIEASINGANGDYYELAVLGLADTAYDDVTGDEGYAVHDYPLAASRGDYTLIPSVRFLSVDDDRLIGAGSFVTSDQGSRVMWTPTWGSAGIANDERLALKNNPYLDLDNYEGGDLTNLSNTVNTYVYATKWRHTYQLARTGVPTRAYEALPLTKQRGAIPHSLVEGFDQGGKPFVFALDPDIGPIQIGGAMGIEPCGGDLIPTTWKRVNLDAIVPATALYFPEKRQVFFWIAIDDHDMPRMRLVLHTNLMRRDPEGTRGGWAHWNGLSSQAVCACLFPDNIDSNDPRTRKLKPFVGVARDAAESPHIIRCDTGHNDAGVEYFARLRTKAIIKTGLLDQFECGEGQLMTRASNCAVDVIIIGMRSDKVQIFKEILDLSLAQASIDEGDHIIHSLDNLSLAELQTVQIIIRDGAHSVELPFLDQWQLELMTLSLTGGQRGRG